jgi:NAD(P)H-dependent FMN reductase
MSHIVIISASVRAGRQSHRVALYFKNYLLENAIGSAEILDLHEYQFPVFEERLKFQENPAANVLEFAEKIRNADGIIMVTPEYNGGYPASLKNVIDLLYAEWYKKPVGIATVSDGVFGGTQVITALQFILWKMKAWTIPAMFPVPSVSKNFDENGVPLEKEATDKRAAGFVKELVWCMEANERMKGEK